MCQSPAPAAWPMRMPSPVFERTAAERAGPATRTAPAGPDRSRSRRRQHHAAPRADALPALARDDTSTPASRRRQQPLGPAGSAPRCRAARRCRRRPRRAARRRASRALGKASPDRSRESRRHRRSRSCRSRGGDSWPRRHAEASAGGRSQPRCAGSATMPSARTRRTGSGVVPARSSRDRPPRPLRADAQAAGRADRDAAGGRALLEDEDARARIVRGDRRDGAGVAVADDDDVVGVSPGSTWPAACSFVLRFRRQPRSGTGGRPPTSSSIMAARAWRPFSAVARVGSPRTPVSL